MEYVLQTHDLCKTYRHTKALDRVNMNIARGDIYGFVGENGSGKTTVIRAVTGLIFPTSGSFTLFGVSSDSPEIAKARKKLGAIVETPSIYLNMSAMENLSMQATILGIQDEEKLLSVLATVGLADLKESKKHAGDFSLGMRQRLGIAMALLGDPEFIILDEPMNGLDPAGIVEVRELILTLNRRHGITFLISSHILTELALVATKYGIISKGRIVQEITAQELVGVCQHTTEISVTDRGALVALLAEDFDNTQMFLTEHGVQIKGDIDLGRVLKKVIDGGLTLTAVNTHTASFEEYYLSLIGGKQHA